MQQEKKTLVFRNLAKPLHFIFFSLCFFPGRNLTVPVCCCVLSCKQHFLFLAQILHAVAQYTLWDVVWYSTGDVKKLLLRMHTRGNGPGQLQSGSVREWCILVKDLKSPWWLSYRSGIAFSCFCLILQVNFSGLFWSLTLYNINVPPSSLCTGSIVFLLCTES